MRAMVLALIALVIALVSVGVNLGSRPTTPPGQGLEAELVTLRGQIQGMRSEISAIGLAVANPTATPQNEEVEGVMRELEELRRRIGSVEASVEDLCSRVAELETSDLPFLPLGC